MPEPVTLEEARRFLRVDADDDDALIATLLVAARQFVEGHTGLVLVGDVATVVPADLRVALLRITKALYDDRDAGSDQVARSLLRRYRGGLV